MKSACLALLLELSGDCLMDELGIHPLGQRAALGHLIRELNVVQRQRKEACE